MRRILIIAFLLGTAIYTADAQLIEDSDRRLKTKRVERIGFLFFKEGKKAKNSEGIPASGTRTSPRYSSISSPFKFSGNVSPRYSSAKDRKKRYVVNLRNSNAPRYSRGNPLRGQDYRIGIRYSIGTPFKGKRYTISPRYSHANPFRGQRYAVSPRYSLGIPFKGNTYRITPRYSKGMPFNANDYSINPRYSKGNPFRGQRYAVSPRYSLGMPFRMKDYKVIPRYSPDMPFRGKDYRIKPRYSAGSPFRGVDFKVQPKYTGTKIGFFASRKDKGNAAYFQYSSLWEGDMKVKYRKIGDQHPSSNYHMAMKFSNPKVRKMFRQWNIFWTRLNGNSQNSKGVNEPVKAPKFDKKERVIWNN